MKKESVLEFLLQGELYCFNTHIVEYVFELEEFEPLEGINPCVLGIAKHDDEAILLVDTLRLFESERKLELQDAKSVVVVQDEQGATYGMVVDAITQIEELEEAPVSVDFNTEDVEVHHYKRKDKIVNEVVPLPLLKHHHVPSFAKHTSLQRHESGSAATQEYVLFRIEDEMYALETSFVEEVVEKEGEMFLLEEQSTLFQGAIAVRENVVRIADVTGDTQGNDLIVVEHKDERFGLLASQVLGIESFVSHKIESLEADGKIEGFYNLHGDVVAIINAPYFLSGKEHEHIAREESVEHHGENKEEYLLFAIDGKDFAIDMKHIRQVVQVEDVAASKSSAIGASRGAEFIAEWNHHAVNVIKLDRVLGTSTRDNGEIIMLEHEERMSGILVDEIDDICYVHAKDVASNKEQNSLIGGALLQGGKVIPTLDPKQILEVA